MPTRFGKVAMVFAHSNHELFAAGLIQRWQPDILFLTQGSTADGSRRKLAHHALQALGHRGRVDFLEITEREVYQRLLSGDEAWFGRVAGEVSKWIETARPDTILTDKFEGYNPIHDLCPLLVDRHLARESRSRACRRFEVPFAAYTLPEVHSYLALHEEVLYLHLTEAELHRKRAALANLACHPADISQIVSAWPEDRFTFEMFAPVSPERNYTVAPAAEGWLSYDSWGREKIQRGDYARAITFNEHFAPLAARLWPRLAACAA